MNISASIRRLTLLFVALFIVLSGGLVYWQVVVASELTASPHNIRKCLPQNAPIRGKIFDRNGVLLAYSQADKNAVCGYTRHYTDPSLAGLIGYYVPGYPAPPSSIEAQYDDVLSGASGRTALDNVINQTLHQPPVGNNIYLTIDDRIQRLVAQDYNNYTPDPTGTNFVNHGYPTFSTNRGAAVVSDPRTGEILAVLSAPGYDPNKMVQTLAHNDLSYFNQLNQDPDNPLIFRPFQADYVPGSIFKTVTLLAALDSGATTLNTEWGKQDAFTPWKIPATATSEGTTVVGDNLGFGKFVFHFPVDTEFGYANSDNIMFAHIGSKVGQAKWLDYTNKMYFDQQIPFDLKTATSRVTKVNGALTYAEFVNDAYGQGIDDVTPLQMSLVDNTVANNGVLMRPMLLSKFTDQNNVTMQTFSPQELNTVVSKDAAYQVRVGMNAVATCGSAWHITEDNRPPTTVIGKTGTAELGIGQNPHSWMITQAPFQIGNEDQTPPLTIVAMRENGGEGAYAVGPAIWRMYSDIFNQGLVKTQLFPWTDPNTFCPKNGLWQ